MENTWTITLSLSEAIALASSRGMHLWLGLPSLADRTLEELEEAVKNGLQSLAARNLLANNEDGVPFIHGALKLVLDTIQFPWQIYSLTSPNGSRWLFLTQDLLLEQQLTADGGVEITAVQDIEALLPRVHQHLFGDVPAAPAGVDYTFPPALVKRLSEMQPGEAVVPEAAHLNLPPALLRALVTLARGNTGATEIFAFNSINPAEITLHLGWLVTSEGIWRMEAEGDSEESGQMMLKATCLDEIKKQIASVISLVQA